MKFKHSLLSKYLREKRLEAGLTQAELAKTLGYTGQFVANWERGASSPPAYVMRKLISALKIPEGEILALLTEESMRYWREAIKPTARRKRA